MKPLTAQQLAEILGARVAAGSPGALVSGGVGTDTRKLADRSVFFALRGENFDGDRFAAAALEGGAAVAVVHAWQGEPPADTAVVAVPDTLAALQRLAAWWRNELRLPVVAITGSNGKTSTKDFAAAVLGERYRVSATRGNLNNHIGVPLTVLGTSEDDTAAVWEMGMNHAGELAPLCEIARPGIGIITNIGTAHIEFLGSREAIAEEKGTLARSLGPEGTLILPADDAFRESLAASTAATVIEVGGEDAAVRAADLSYAADGTKFTLRIEGEGEAEVFLPVAGHHMVTNALLAAAAGWKLGVPLKDIAAGLSAVRLTSGRLRRFDCDGVTVIDDTYNANPESMAAAIETLANTPVCTGAKRIIVLGRMGELGAHAPAAHHRTGELAAARGLTLIAFGEGAEGIARGAGDAPFFPSVQDAAAWLAREAKPGDVVLFKGSRTAAVERVMHTAFPQN